ncbi:MAG: DNA repair protein RecN [Acutalibacteraceae bacterium]|jgi:DNA repair protein RecN (Recombination protein N)
MLTNLNIENIAVIERSSIDFHPGLNVLTGETGAGKSIIIDSLNAVLGERTSRELIRTGAEKARVTALFEDISVRARATLNELGLQDEENAVLIQREIAQNGKSSFRVNGIPATASMVRDIGKSLVNIHGQHENQQLLSPHLHIHYLDSLGDLQWQLEEYYQAYRRAVELKHQMDSLNLDTQDKERRIDLLQYQIDELEQAEISLGEHEELSARKAMISNAEKIATGIGTARSVLSGEEESSGVVQQLAAVSQILAEAAKYLPALQNMADRTMEISYELQNIGEDLRSYAEQADFDPEEINRIEERLDTLYRLGLKYGKSEEDMLAYLEKAKQELDSMQFADERRAKLEEEYRQAGTKAKALALALSEKRRQAAEIFVEQVTAELAFLDMPGVKLQVAQQRCHLNATGCDEIEFLISTNPGEPPKPMAKVASGGELSRIMLAIKNVLADKDDIDTLIFDEVDAGISGRAAQKVGQKLRQVAQNRQVLCVTHLAQIAAQANSHLLIEKQVRDARTYTDVRLLDRTGRRYELARIMSGTDPSRLQLQSAEEMLQAAEKT